MARISRTQVDVRKILQMVQLDNLMPERAICETVGRPVSGFNNGRAQRPLEVGEAGLVVCGRRSDNVRFWCDSKSGTEQAGGIKAPASLAGAASLARAALESVDPQGYARTYRPFCQRR